MSSTSGITGPGVQVVPFGTELEVLPIVYEQQPDLARHQPADHRRFNQGVGHHHQRCEQPRLLGTNRPLHGSAGIGQTFAIGGLIQTTIAATATKVPFFGDLPFAGTLASTVNYQTRESELVILVTRDWSTRWTRANRRSVFRDKKRTSTIMNYSWKTSWKRLQSTEGVEREVLQRSVQVRPDGEPVPVCRQRLHRAEQRATCQAPVRWHAGYCPRPADARNGRPWRPWCDAQTASAGARRCESRPEDRRRPAPPVSAAQCRVGADGTADEPTETNRRLLPRRRFPAPIGTAFRKERGRKLNPAVTSGCESWGHPMIRRRDLTN